MNNSLKKLVPFLLALLILVSLFWYFLVFDRGFTRDLILSQARHYATHSNPSLASWFYDLAYDFSGQDEHVAIELANQFKQKGNYTKAEFTLSNAIADGGTDDLYIALCKTYVEQDKLLDAENMLQNVTNPAIKEELEAMRPKAPVTDPAPGFYRQYIPVTLSSDGGTIYFTTDNSYPSTDRIPYSAPFELPAGETIIHAISVADNGLVSPLATYTFTVGGVIEPVHFEDSSIEAAIRKQLRREDEKIVYTNEVWEITSFTVPTEAENLNDLRYMTHLESLTIHDQAIDSLGFLTSLSALKTLDLTGCRFNSENLTYIGTLVNLSTLILDNCSLSTLTGIESLKALTVLDLSNNTIRNLDPIGGLQSLKHIELDHNAVTDISVLGMLPNLETLDISYNAVTSVAPLVACIKLTKLNLETNSVTTLSGLESVSTLTHLYAAQNKLTDVSNLGECIGLIELDLSNNSISDIQSLSSLSKLEILYFANNSVTELPKWADGCPLRSIDGSYNQLESIASLKNMGQLTHIFMDYNKITSVKELKSCYKLVQVNIYGNAISGVEVLTEHDVIVNYDPTLAENPSDITD